MSPRRVKKDVKPANDHQWDLRKEAESQREAALEALRKSEEQFRAMFETASIGMAQADIATGQWLRVNQKMCEITGYSAEEMLALRVTEITHPEDRELDWASFQNVVSGKLPNYRMEKRYIRKDGSIIWVNVNMTIVRDVAGQPIRTIATIEDITGRKRAEAELERSRDFVENVEDACFEMDLSGNLVFCNESFLKLNGYTYDEYMALSRWDRHPTREEARRVFKIYEDVYRTGIPVKSIEYKNLHNNGTTTIAEVSISLVRDKSGNPVGFRGVGRDITDRRRTESQKEAALEALRESEDKFRVLVDSTPTAVMLYQDDRWIYANKATEAICGYSEEELRSMNFWDIVHPEFKQIVQKEGRKRQQGEKTTNRHELKIITKDGREKWVDTSGSSTMLQGRLAGILSVLDITESKKAEEGLREAHRRLDEIIDYLPDATFVIDTGGKVIAWNRAIEQMTGIIADDMLGKGNYEYALPFYGERRPILIDLVLNPQEDIEAKYVSTQRRDPVLEGEAYIPALRRGEVYLFGRASALQDSKGNIVGAIESIRDITARRQAEEKYRAIFDNAVEGVFQTTPEGRILSVNPAMVNLSGYDSPEDFMHNVNNIVQIYANPDDRLSFRKEIEEKGSVNKYEVLCIRKDGQKIWITVNARAIKNKEGHIIHYDGFFEDITERKKMEYDLHKNTERLRSIMETSNAGIITMTQEGKILFANRQMAKMFGYDHQEFLSINYFDLVAPDERAGVVNNIKTLQYGESERLSLERHYLRKDGMDLWGYVSGGRLDIAQGAYQVVLVVSDITRLKQAETDNKLMEEHLRQAQKMEAIGTLAGGIAHDFNNILASTMGFTEMAVKETRQLVRQDYLDQVLKACERAKNLVNQIMAFSRRREQELKPLAIRLILKEALGLLRATLPTTIEIKKDITQEEAYVLADPTQIHQIIMNLCTNAAHAMRAKGGLLDIRLSSIQILHPLLSPHPDLQAGAYVCLFVRDTGHGIDDAIKDKIFDPFFTTKQAREGTGLGLSVVYGIVKSYGGAIDVQSSVGKGAAFTIYLPRVISEGRTAEADRKDIELQGHERILFVDDEEMLVRMTKIYFESLGYTMTATTSSGEALRMFQEDPGSFDLVITDMTMPQLTGTELSLAILKIRPEIPIILCTGYSDSINMADARKLNLREFILKPISLTDLGLVVRRVLESEDKRG